MHNLCKFCRRVITSHTEDCPREMPGADARYDAGWLDGRRGRESTTDDAAYKAGWLRGDVARDEAENGCDW